jgi:hypothetical protein
LTSARRKIYFGAVPHANPVMIDSHAAATLRYIRASMEAAGTFAVPGSAGITVGCIGLLTAAAAAAPALRHEWLAVWLAAAVPAATAGGILLVRRATLNGCAPFGAPLRRFLLCLLPGLLVGGVMTALHWQAGNLHAIPGTWLLCYGCALISTSAWTGRPIAFLGGAFAALGLVALLLPDSLHNLALGAGFGGLHLVFGVLTARSGNGLEI